MTKREEYEAKTEQLLIPILEENQEEAKRRMQIVKDKWKEKFKVLAYYIEHNELEKVETNLTNIKSFINRKEKNLAISGIDEANFILKHIKEKNAFNLENIF